MAVDVDRGSAGKSIAIPAGCAARRSGGQITEDALAGLRGKHRGYDVDLLQVSLVVDQSKKNALFFLIGPPIAAVLVAVVVVLRLPCRF